MIQFQHTLRLEHGIHGRPATELVSLAKGQDSRIQIACGGKTADARRIFALMALGSGQGDTITVTVEGPDETQAAEALEALLEERF